MRTILEIPGMRISRGLNAREHPMARHRRVKTEKDAVGWSLRAHLKRPGLPAVVTMTRVYGARGKPYDDDNLAGGFKAARDAIAQWLGVDDADPRVTWECRQEPGKAYAVRIEIGDRSESALKTGTDQRMGVGSHGLDIVDPRANTQTKARREVA